MDRVRNVPGDQNNREIIDWCWLAAWLGNCNEARMNTNAIRSRLQKRRAELVRRLERITREVRHTSGLEADFEEQAVQRENDDVLAGLDDKIRLELLQIESALGRLNETEYGVCEACHKPIGSKRLDAVPYATRCVACEPGAGIRSA
jgi:DnaK suppressor protein